MGSISYNRQNVNIQGVPFDQVVDTTQQQEDGGGWRYSFGGRNANAADLDALNHAQEMERQGVAHGHHLPGDRLVHRRGRKMAF